MKNSLLALGALLLVQGPSLASPAAAPLATPAVKSTVATSPGGATSNALAQSNAKRDKFRKAFQNARKIKATKEMKTLISRNTDEASMWMIELAYGQARYPSDTKLELYEDLEKAWKSAKRTDFGQEMRLYYGGLEDEDFKVYDELEKEYHALVAEYFALKPNEGKADPKAIVAMGERFSTLAKKWREIKCDYFASQCWSFVGGCNDKYMAKGEADLDAACDAYGECVDARDRIGLHDRLHKETTLRYQALVKARYGVDGKAAADEAAERGEAGPVASDLSVMPMRFEVLQKPLSLQRPNYFADEHYAIWHAMWLKEVGSESPEVLRLAELWKEAGVRVSLRRDGASKIFLDLDGDGERTDTDVDIPVKGKLEPVTVEVDVNGKKRSTAFYVQTGQESDQYQGFAANMAATDTIFGIFATPGGSLVGEVDGETIRIIDEDMNGQYGGVSQGFGHVGLTKGHFHPEFDSVLVGSSKRALPFSKYMFIGKGWYELAADPAAAGVSISPVELETGTVQLKFKGPKPDWMVLEGTGRLQGTLIDIAASGKVEVPVGDYKLLAGVVAKGKKRQRMKALVLPGSDTSGVEGRSWQDRGRGVGRSVCLRL